MLNPSGFLLGLKARATFQTNNDNVPTKISKTKALFLLVLATVFLGLTFKAPERCFANDDFAIIYSAKHIGLSGIKSYFTSLPNDKLVLPTHDKKESSMSFLSVSYRPLMMVIYALEYPIFGDNAHSYFLLSIFLHALASALLVLVFSLFTTPLSSTALAILFGFYPFMTKCVGRIALQSYSLTLIFLILAFLALKKAIDSDRLGFLALAGLLFSIPMFIHEQVVLFPAWIALASFYYIFSTKKPGFQKGLWQTIKFVWPFFAVVFFYLGLRLFMFGFSSQGNGVFDPAQILAKFKTRKLDLLTFVTDTFGLNVFPPNSPFLKGFLLIMATALSLTAFAVCSHKFLVLMLACGFFSLSWPSILLKHESRYIYIALPFLLCALAVCLESLRHSKTNFEILLRKALKGAPILLALVGLFECRRNISAFSSFFGPSTKAIEKFVKNLDGKTQSLFFVGVPKDYIRRFGVAQAVWFFSPPGSGQPEVHFDEYLNVLCNKTDSVYNSVPNQEMVKIKINGQQLELESLDPELAWFETSGPFNNRFDCLIGKLESVEDFDERRAKKVSVNVDQVDLSQATLVSWNFKKQQLEILKKP